MIPSIQSSNERVIFVPSLQEVLTSGQLVPNFQKIVELANPSRVGGFEALARYRENCIWSNPALLFDYAERLGQVAALDMACVEQSIAYGAATVDGSLLFVNLHPSSLDQPLKLASLIASSCELWGLAPERLVLEVTEHAAIQDREAAIDTFGLLRQMGVRFAIDDMGAAHSHLSLIDEIRPSFMKVSGEFGRDIEQYPTHQKIVRNIVSLARDFDAEVIIESVETAETADVARELGVRYGQGYYFARPVSPIFHSS